MDVDVQHEANIDMRADSMGNCELYCPVCLSLAEQRLLLSSKDRRYHLYACEKCELRRLHPIPEREIHQGLYRDENNYDSAKAGYSLRSAVFYLEKAREITNTNAATLLDIGAGLGYYSNAFATLGLKVTYAEPDAISYQFAKKHQKKINVFMNTQIDILLAASPQKYDIIFCRHVIEHIFDPLLTLKNLVQCCHDNTVIIFETDNNASSEILEHPETRAYWSEYYFNEFNVTDLGKLKELRVTALGVKNTHYWSYTIKNLDMLLQHVGFEKRIAYDYHLGDKNLWPNVPDYTSISSYLRMPVWVKYLPEIYMYISRQKKRNGAGIIYFGVKK